jgi:uncharacterized GH25 family protein
MRRYFGALLAITTVAVAAHGHALYLVPDAADPGKAVVVFGHGLAPEKVRDGTWKKVAGLKLTALDGSGKATELKFTEAKDHLAVAVPPGTRAVFGQVEYGVFAKEGAKPRLVKYYPKALLGAEPADRTALTSPPLLEVLPVREGGKTRFRVVMMGKPVAGAAVEVLLPEKQEHADATTDDEGLTPGFEGVGRFGVTARVEVPKAGELNGQKYEVIAYTATLVVDVK